MQKVSVSVSVQASIAPCRKTSGSCPWHPCAPPVASCRGHPQRVHPKARPPHPSCSRLHRQDTSQARACEPTQHVCVCARVCVCLCVYCVCAMCTGWLGAAKSKACKPRRTAPTEGKKKQRRKQGMHGAPLANMTCVPLFMHALTHQSRASSKCVRPRHGGLLT